jgi:hypothetical protein
MVWVKEVQPERRSNRIDSFLDDVFNPIFAPVAVVFAFIVLLTR